MTDRASQAPDLTEKILPDLLPYLLQRASYLVTNEFHRKLRLDKMHPNRWRMMIWLSENQPYSISELTDRLMLKQPSVTQIVDSAVRDGLVRKAPDTNDARRIMITLTEEGEQLISEVKLRALAARANLDSALGPDLARRLSDCLRETIEQLE